MATVHTISVRVKTNAKVTSVTKENQTTYRVAVTSAPQHGKANVAVQKALAHYFDVPRSCVTLRRGFAGKDKRWDITF